MEMTVLRSGMLTTVQDLGRRGFRDQGVPLSGAMDPLCLRLANSLVGNPEDFAALEFTLVGPNLEFSHNALVALTGVECNGMPSWKPFEVRAGERIDLGPCKGGCRGYLAVRGGIDVPVVLGSRSTYLRGGWGGLEGRTLREGDNLKIGRVQVAPCRSSASKLRWQIDPRMLPIHTPAPTVRVMRGDGRVQAADELLRAKFSVSPRSDRMGVRLAGVSFPGRVSEDMLSSAVGPGTIQLPPDGQPVILMADAQTIGGYPQIAHVISVDLSLVAQLRPQDHVSFAEVSLQEAQRLALKRDHFFALLRAGLADKLGFPAGDESS
jgi:antagonist of KipI